MMSAARPDVSVVTAFYKNDATFPAQLAALAQQAGAPSFEVVVADNEGSESLLELIAPFSNDLDIRVVHASDIRGQCHARNRGVAESRAAVIAMCDADDVVSPTWIRALYDQLANDDVLATGPIRLDRINPEVIWRAKARIDGLSEVPHPYLQFPFGYLGYERFVFGSNLGVRRSTYLELGGMDESMLGGSEDVDFTWRAIESGRQIAVSDDAVIDYRMRTDPKAAMAQQFRYQRAQLGLWARSRRMGRPVRGMSFRWVLSQTARIPWEWYTARNADEGTQYVVAAHTGGVLGNLVGQVSVRRPWRR